MSKPVENPDGKQRLLVFVYGSLKVGFRNHLLMRLLNAILVDDGARLRNYALYEVDKADFPAITPERDHVTYGEVFSVPREYMQFLDRLEGVKQNIYTKALLPVQFSNGDSLPTLVYVAGMSLRKHLGRKVVGGRWLKYHQFQGNVRPATKPNKGCQLLANNNSTAVH